MLLRIQSCRIIAKLRIVLDEAQPCTALKQAEQLSVRLTKYGKLDLTGVLLLHVIVKVTVSATDFDSVYIYLSTKNVTCFKLTIQTD